MARKNGNGAAAADSIVEVHPITGVHAIEETDPHDVADAVDFAAETLIGDMRDFILDRLKHEQAKLPWHQRSEADQRDTVHQVEAHVQAMVKRAVELIAAQGRRSIRATLEQITIKDGIKATVSLSKFDEQRHSLVDAQGASILIVVADPEEFQGERAPAEITPDQGKLPVDAAVVHSTADGVDVPFH